MLRSLQDRNDRVEGDRTAPLYVDMLWNQPETAIDRSLFQDGVKVRVGADISPWHTVHWTWWYQLACRWLSAALYAVAFALSATFLVQHGALIRDRIAGSRKSGSRLLGHTLSQITLIHLALLVAALKNGVMMFNALLGGFLSVPIMPFEIQMFLASSLIGIENAVNIITARFWHQVISKSDDRSSSRAWSCPVALLLCLFSIVADSFIGASLAMNESGQQLEVLTLLVLLFTLATFVYFVCSLTRFQLQLRRTQTQAKSRPLSGFIRRLSFRASWLTATLFAFLVIVVASALVRSMREGHLHFGMMVSVVCIVLPLRSTFSVSMLQPRTNDSSRAAVQMASNQKSSPSTKIALKKLSSVFGIANSR